MKTRRETLRLLRDALPLLWAELDAFTRRRLSWSLGLMILVALLSGVTPLILQMAIDKLTAGQGEWHRAFLIVEGLIIGFVGAQYLTTSIGELRTYVHGRGVQRLRRRLSARLFRHILRLPLRLHLDRKSGAVTHVLSQGLSGFQSLMQHVFFTLVPVAIELLAIIGVLVFIGEPTYLAIFGISGVLYLIVFIYGAKRIVEPARAVNSTFVESNALMTDTLLNYEMVKCFNYEEEVSDRVEGVLEESEEHNQRLAFRRMLNGQLTALISFLCVGSTLSYAGYEVFTGSFTVGAFVLMHTYAMRLKQPLEAAGVVIRDLTQAGVNFEKMMEILREAPEPDRIRGADPVEVRGALKFENVSFSYGPDRPVLRNVSFDVRPGSTVAVVGLSGSGKSTLVRLLYRLFPLDGGQIVLDGVPITEFSLQQLRCSIAAVLQDTVLFHRSIGENIGVGRPGSTQAEIEAAAKLAQLHELIMGWPEGYETKVGERGIKLSGGQKQRVAIARAALKRAPILVFDEATSSLDSKTEAEILRNLHALASGSTTLVIAHRLSTIVHADEIVMLHEGVIKERGTHAELLALGGDYAALWHSQFRENQDRQKVSIA